MNQSNQADCDCPILKNFEEDAPSKMHYYLTMVRLQRELKKAYKQIRHMRTGLDQIVKELESDRPSEVMVKFIAYDARNVKDFKQYVGCSIYDDGYLVTTGLRQEDTRQKRVDSNRVDAHRIQELIWDSKDKNRDKILELVENIMQPNSW